MRKHTFIIGIISSTSFIVGALLKYFHIPGSGMLMSLGVIIFILGFGISFLVDRFSIESRKSFRIALILLAISLALLLTSSGLLILKWFDVARSFGYSGMIAFLIFAVYFNRNIEGRKLRLRKSRQLASILFTDIKSFTQIMGEDEFKSIQLLDENRKLQKRLIRKYRGKWIKEIGDGTLAIFYTATEAVLCAHEMQQETKQSDYKLKIGIHISEVVFTDDDIYGDGVNVASRITDHAKAGEICITETVYHNIKNREELEVESVGAVELKNVAYPVDLYKIIP